MAYVDHRTFGALPYPGGTFAQPAWMMAELRYIHGVITERERTEREREERRARARGGHR